MRINSNNMEIKKTNIDKNGDIQSYMPAVPLGMTCEHHICNKSEGRDYKRKGDDDEWGDEPIFLCKEHSFGYDPI